jgi:cytochrome c-type biogenesis protein CcmH
MKRFAAACLLILMSLLPAQAVMPDEVLSDPALEARARILSKELRCLVCQNQSIDDSDAELAKDLRVIVRERLSAGDSDEAILDFVVERYGEFVLLKPRINAGTVLLWASPLLLVFAGVFLVVMRQRRNDAASGVPIALSTEEEERLAAMLAGQDQR